jgi:hypothetical protein
MNLKEFLYENFYSVSLFKVNLGFETPSLFFDITS